MAPAPNQPIFVHMTPQRVERFWSRVAVCGSDECWPWLGRCTPQGYGSMSIEPRGSGQTLNLLAHRISKTLKLGHDSDQPILRHTCHNPPCCNFAHTIEGTPFDNAWDSIAAGRYTPWGGAGGRRGTAHPASRYDEEQRRLALRLRYRNHMSQQDIAVRVGCHRQSVRRWCHDYELALLENPLARITFK